ncbi:MAG: amino acid ABC transporter permease [Peptococcaceae bacterium]|nr:amino acid ABC transporter permease [Peptococcaceae bacterium]
MDVVLRTYPILLWGALSTLQISLISIALGCVLGLAVGLARLSGYRIIRTAASIYIDFFRGTPLLVQIFLIYFGLPHLLRQSQLYLIESYNMPQFFTQFALPVFLAAVVSCSLNSGAYIAEIFRAGVQSIERGQMEAARSLGMTTRQAMRYVILPQAFKVVIPPLGNEFIALLKDTSLLSVIGFEELTRKGQLTVGWSYAAFPIWITVAFLYLVMTFGLSRLVDYTERRLKTGD